jgi:hypothetical protein
MKAILFFLFTSFASCAAARPIDVCVDLPKSGVDAGVKLDASADVNAKGD